MLELELVPRFLSLWLLMGFLMVGMVAFVIVAFYFFRIGAPST